MKVVIAVFIYYFQFQMQQGEAKQIDLVDYQQLEEAQSQNHSQHLNIPPAQKSEANGSFLFQIDSPKQKISQVVNAQNEGSTHDPTQNIQQIDGNTKTQQTPFSYQLDLNSQQYEEQRQNNEQTQEIKRQLQAKKYNTVNHEQMVGTKSSKQIDQVSQDNREDRMNRRKKKSTFKDILNGSQNKHQKIKAGESFQNNNQLKNIEYAKTQQHTYVPQVEHQRTDVPLKQDPLTVAQRIQGLREQNPKQLRQTKQLPPLKRQRTKKQQQQPSFLYNNDSSLMALDKVTDVKNKSESVAPSCIEQGVFKHFAFKAIPPDSTIKFLFKRQKNCMQNYYHPQYSLVFNLNKHIFSARKEWGHINSHYNISCEEKNYAKTGNYYAGYLKGNFTGTCFNLFSFNDLASQLVATIIYKAELSCIQQSYRQFEVYIKNNDYAYSQLSGYQQGETINLQELYEISDNVRASKIIKLVNKKAEWSQSLGAFVMNFRGNLKIPSVKNMILVQQGKQHHNVLMLCKQSQNEFYMQAANPLDPFLAMGIALSSFDFKLFCQ